MSECRKLLVSLFLLGLCLRGLPASARVRATTGQSPASTATAEPGQTPFFLHAIHATKLSMDCSLCHVPEKQGSVVFRRPGHGHQPCMICHAEAFGKKPVAKVCAQCHSTFPPSGSADLLPFPRFKNQRPIVFEFSHALHVDPVERNDPRTGLRADCAFCHHFDAQGSYATFPRHPQCAACHSKPGMKPLLSEKSTSADCRGCHNPEEIENPSVSVDKRLIASYVVSGVYANMKFSHIAHLKLRTGYHVNCTTCHYAVPQSSSLANLTLPKMVDCAKCHDTDKTIPAAFRMSNCQVCHVDKPSGAVPVVYARYAKPAWHNESFRLHHAQAASAPGASCFVCHTNVSPSATTQEQCVSCHQTILPASHTARWRDDLHGKYAAIDRSTCAVCHTADYCIRCHNELPRSHVPLPLFKGGAHARLAMLNERSCLTCHTFENTCAECHVRKLQ